MENNLKKFRTAALMLVIILISIIAFVGIYKLNLNSFKNIVPDYQFGMEIGGTRELRFKVDTDSEEKEVYVDENGNIMGEVKESEEKEEESTETQESEEVETEEEPATEENVTEESEKKEEKEEIPYSKETKQIKRNDDSVLTKENYEKSKKIIQNRIDSNQTKEFNIRLNSENGEIIVDVPNNSNVKDIYKLLETRGHIQFVDHQTGLILIEGNHINEIAASYSTTANGYTPILQIEFDKEGAEKLREVSKKYVSTTDENGKTEIKYVDVTLDGDMLVTTYFGDELKAGIVQLPVGQATTDVNKFRDTLEAATLIANIVDSGETPVVYKLDADVLINSGFNEKYTSIIKIAALATLLLITVIFTIKFKFNGLIAGISNIGFVSLVLLTIRYSNVTITVNSIITLFVMICLNIVFLKGYLKNTKDSSKTVAFNKSAKKYYLNIIPFIVTALIFTFMSNVTVSSIGMVMFWCLFIQVIYNFIITKNL